MKFGKHFTPIRKQLALTRSVLAFLAWVVATNAWCWGSQGHQAIAGIAQANLTPKARSEINRLLALEPGVTMVSISTWADEHRSPATGAWHYVNFPRDTCTYNAERDCPNEKCVVGAIAKQASILEFDISDEKRLTALKYLIHFVGDVYQPLHAGYMDDKGGNTYQLQADMRGSNLHALWDTGLIRNLELEDLCCRGGWRQFCASCRCLVYVKANGVAPRCGAGAAPGRSPSSAHHPQVVTHRRRAAFLWKVQGRSFRRSGRGGRDNRQVHCRKRADQG